MYTKSCESTTLERRHSLFTYLFEQEILSTLFTKAKEIPLGVYLVFPPSAPPLPKAYLYIYYTIYLLFTTIYITPIYVRGCGKKYSCVDICISIDRSIFRYLPPCCLPSTVRTNIYTVFFIERPWYLTQIQSPDPHPLPTKCDPLLFSPL